MGILIPQAMVILIPDRKGGWASGNDLCPPAPEKMRGVIMAIPIPLLQGRREGGHDICHSLPDKWKIGHGHPHPSSPPQK